MSLQQRGHGTGSTPDHGECGPTASRCRSNGGNGFSVLLEQFLGRPRAPAASRVLFDFGFHSSSTTGSIGAFAA
jgi:hypothetical protein